MSENMIKTIEASLESVEEQIKAGEKVSSREINKLENRINNLASVFNMSAADIQKYQSRIDSIRQNVESSKKSFVLIPVAAKDKIVSAVQKHPVRTVIVIAGVAITLIGCGVAKSTENAQQVSEIETSNDDIDSTIENETMDVEYKEMADEIVASMNDSISKGLVVTEENKEVMAKKYALYYMLNQMDTLTDEQWANIFQNSNITAKDIMDAKYDIEYFGEQAVIASEEGLDYSSMFKGNDSKLLTDAKELFDNVRNSDGKDRKEAEKAFIEYINENLVLNKGNINYSNRALDTFRKIYFDAFDTITGGKVIDDELEHHVNTVVTCSIAENNLNVEDETIVSLQSKYTTYLEEKLAIRLQTGWNHGASNEVNPNNDINEISIYVSENIDLSLYKEMPDYKETLRKILSKDEKKSSKDNSGVSDGQGGIVSKSDIEAHGVDPTSPTAKEDYEQAVEDETHKKEEESVGIQDNSGKVVQDAELLKYYAQLGASDYNSGTYDESKVPEQYLNVYRQGMTVAKATEEAAKKQAENQQQNYYEEVQNGPITSETITETSGYTEQIPEQNNNVQPSPEVGNDTVTEFVPLQEFESIENSSTIIEEEVETSGYVEVSSRINQLEQLRQELLASNVSLTEEENVKTI